MPLPSVSFLAGIVVGSYLFSFVIFAVLRIVTGVSIQRIGLSGLRRVVFSPRHGVKVSVRGLGLSLHRKTFALPTLCSLLVQDLTVTIDLQALSTAPEKQSSAFDHQDGKAHDSDDKTEQDDEDGHGRLWRRLTQAKERIKRIHSQITWLRLLDLVATAMTIEVVGVGSLQVERLTLSVDTRKEIVDRSRLFQHHKQQPATDSPAEWKVLIRSVLFRAEGCEPTEILDYCTVNVHGMLQQQREGLRDASIALKLGRLTVPWDDIEHAKRRIDMLRETRAQSRPAQEAVKVSFADVIDEMEEPGSRNRQIVRAVSDSRAFIASILRGIQEVQFAVGYIGVSRRLSFATESNGDVYLNVAMKELGLDILRLDPRSPAHRMYFSTKDIAHQALLTGIAISAGIDDGPEHPERMLYIPMITATIKTTLPSRTIHYLRADDPSERNTNILYANLVCTSPSIDLDPKHLPLIQEMLKQRRASGGHGVPRDRNHLISRLLPKAHLKLSIQEPVIRISLPPMDKSNSDDGDFDLLVSAVSSVALECESSHADGKNHYSLSSYYRHSRHRLYYQTAAGDRYDLLRSDFVEVQVDVNAVPAISVTATARAQTFTIFLVRPDICKGIRQIVKQLRRSGLVRNESHRKKHMNFLRSMPIWLERFRLEGSDFGLELGGVDNSVSEDTRGIAIQLESWTVEYSAHYQRVQGVKHTRRPTNRSISGRDKHAAPIETETQRKRVEPSFADGRRLVVHLQNVEGLIVDSVQESQSESFMSLPRFEVAFSTSTDAQGPIFHVNSHAKTILLQYSLYNHFAIGIAVLALKRTFLEPGRDPDGTTSASNGLDATILDAKANDMEAREITSFDFKSNLFQIKAQMPADPPMMIQVYNIETGRHRWSHPFFRARLVRLYVKVPRMEAAWSRIISVKSLRLDLRETRRKVGKSFVPEKLLEATTETIRFAIPHSLVVHNIFDNITNVIKTTKQMHHHFVTGNNDSILSKEPEAPKRVPRIIVRAQTFLFDIEDSNFEWKLGAIYRAGLLEQKQRLAREEAFKLKVKRLARTSHRGQTRMRTQSATPAERAHGQASAPESAHRRSQSAHAADGLSPPHSPRQPRHRMRYDAGGKNQFSDSNRVTLDQARARLDSFNSQSWKSRIDRVMSFQHQAIADMRTMFWGSDDLPENAEQHEPILAMSKRPGLMLIAFTELNIVIDKPSFPVMDFPQFLHTVGKGMPMDMKYGLVIPMNLHITMSEARVKLRDYPLMLLHVPPLSSAQSQRLPALSMRTDFVIAEEYRDAKSQRSVCVEVVPPSKMGDGSGKAYSVNVQRTISAMKTYSDIKFEINTSNPTKLTWSTSYQPAIQEAMQAIEGFTKPPFDPSDKVGFWDKVRLSFHSRVNVAWKGDGDFHFILKGSRDPYVVTGQGAGLVMVWRNDVNWKIGQDPDPRKFMQVESGEYILAVPDLSNYARQAQTVHGQDDNGSSISSASTKKDAVFQKVVMKLSGEVNWLVGLMFERDTPNGGRTFASKNHYDVVLKHPDFAQAPPGQEYDAYRGFRSQYIHMSIAIAAPHDRDWSLSNTKASNNYNSVHLTPRFFSHFFSWWSMFSGMMSLPIRQGPLWGTTEKKSKKFGRHLATMKYNLLLSPLYVSHVYKHKDAEDYASNIVSATGLKMRLDSFMLDLHQRREHFELKARDGARTKKTSAIRINQAQLDFISADLRALSASIAGTNTDALDKGNDETFMPLHTQAPSVDISKFEIPDNDFSWIDMDDFVELDWILPTDSDPETKILPLGYAPRFTYFRQTDHKDKISNDPTRTSTFGHEPTHFCVMSADNDPRRVQAELIEKRLTLLKEKEAHNSRAVGEQELKVVRESSEGDKATNEALRATLETLRGHSEHLRAKHDFLQDMLQKLLQRLQEADPAAMPNLDASSNFFEAHEDAQEGDDPDPLSHVDSKQLLADYRSDFNNRFIVHNAQIKWNNSLRNIILRYIHQNSQRRGFVYYMSRKAIKFLLDVVEERRSKVDGMTTPKRQKTRSSEYPPMSPEADDEMTIQDRIDELLRDGRSFVNADEATRDSTDSVETPEEPAEDVSVEFTPLNTYHFRLIAPQVQLQSDKHPKSVVLVTAKGMQLKVVQIMEKDKIDDDVSGLVQRRFMATADSLQMFVASTKTFSTDQVHFYSANRYGTKAGTHWPPWVPTEVMFQYQSSPYGFDRIIHRTSASLRYDKYNQLRLKYNEDISGGNPQTSESAQEAEDRMDHVWVSFPHLRAICDSTQYFAMYVIVMDLLLYSEPLEKTRSERLEKIMLASDFSDLTGAPEMVYMLQDRIRQLEEIKMQFQVNEQYLDRQGWKDRIAMDQDLAGCEDELFFMMKAITTSQQRIEDRRDQENSTGILHTQIASKEIAWHLIRDKGESLMEVQLKNASFKRTDNSDGSNYNAMEIGRINGYNLLNDALYPEIIAPFTDNARGGRPLHNMKMLRIHWLMLEAIAGIPVVDYFEIDVVPLKLQVEREVAKKLFEYIFPGVGGNAFEGGGFSPFMVKNMVPEHELDVPEHASDPAQVNGFDDMSQLKGLADPDGPGALEQRLKPTLALQNGRKAKAETKGLGISSSSNSLSGFSLFHHTDRPRSSKASTPRQNLAQVNLDSVSRLSSDRSLLTLKSGTGSGITITEKSKRLPLHRSVSDDKKKKGKDKDKDKEPISDDLTQMMNRASNYMTLAFVKIPSLVLCLSYKGQGKRNIEDVRDLVFRLPTLEYRNKTWSNLDLALQLKKDVIRALIGHAGAIVGNKFQSHKPSRQQQSRLRELVSRNTFTSPFNSAVAAETVPAEWEDKQSDTESLGGSFQSSTRPRSARPTSSVMSRSLYNAPSLRESDDNSADEIAEDFPTAEHDDRRLSSRPSASRTGNVAPGNGNKIEVNCASMRDHVDRALLTSLHRRVDHGRLRFLDSVSEYALLPTRVRLQMTQTHL
jgi:hypothetical protein